MSGCLLLLQDHGDQGAWGGPRATPLWSTCGEQGHECRVKAQGNERWRGEPWPWSGCGTAGSSTAPRPQHVPAGASATELSTAPCVSPGLLGGGWRASTAVLELAQARLGLPDSMSFMNQVPGSASGEADPRQMPPAGSQRRTRVEGGHSRGQVCPQ